MLEITHEGDRQVASFRAMASPCEVHLDLDEPLLARQLAETAHAETLRIETILSRYRDDNVVAAINRSDGRPVTVDPETADLLDFAHQCFQLSGGRFDITSGVLRRLWRFEGRGHLPKRAAVKALLPMIGWHRVTWQRPIITLPPSMEIDLGGIGKEYAVDRVVALLQNLATCAGMVNFGGDLRAWGTRRDGRPWSVGVETPDVELHAARQLELTVGALATSGDARRYLMHRGQRYSHILNPRTGWPVRSAPRSVTVLGDTCLEAGFLATLAMLYGRRAKEFLTTQDVRHWVIR